MIWTSEKPTQEGWYWHRWSALHDVHIRRVVPHPKTQKLYAVDFGPIEESDGQWCGPIEPPQEDV